MNARYLMLAVLILGLAIPAMAYAQCAPPVPVASQNTYACPSQPAACGAGPANGAQARPECSACTAQDRQPSTSVRQNSGSRLTDLGPKWYVNCQRYPYCGMTGSCPD